MSSNKHRIKKPDIVGKKGGGECAPTVHGDICSRDHIIEQMKKFVKQETGKDVSDKKHILNIMNKILGCDSESCVLAHPEFVKEIGHPVAEKEKKERFRPHGPSNSTALLNNFNIDEVLDQYTQKHHEFHHIPFRMIDFRETEPGEFSQLVRSGMHPAEAKSKL